MSTLARNPSRLAIEQPHVDSRRMGELTKAIAVEDAREAADAIVMRNAATKQKADRNLALFFERNKVTPTRIYLAIERKTGVTLLRVNSSKRDDATVQARQLAWWLMRRIAEPSFPQMQRMFKRHHTTIMHGIRAVDGRRKRYPQWRELSADLLAELSAPERDPSSPLAALYWY